MKLHNVFDALADSTRRWVIERLSQIESETASDLAEQLPISRQAVSKHIGILEDAGLVSSRQVGRERQYSLNPEALLEATDWIDEISRQWDRQLERLKNYLSMGEGETQDETEL